MSETESFQLSAEIVCRWREALEKSPEEGSRFYFAEIFSKVVDFLAKQPRHRDLPKIDVLVSLLGFSPETTGIATLLLRPKRLIVLTSRKTADYYDILFDYLIKNDLIKASNVEAIWADAGDPLDLHKRLLDALEGSSGRRVVDVTGGKKVMSATAAQLAWELKLELCYIEGDYDPKLRRPGPGSEHLIMLPDPNQQQSRQRRAAARHALRNQSPQRAIEALKISKDANQEHSFEELALALCELRARWMDFDLLAMKGALKGLDEILQRPATGIWLGESKLADIRVYLSPLRSLLDESATERAALARIASFFALAAQYESEHRYDFAALLFYRAIEALIELGLQSRAPGFVMASPDYSLLGDEGAISECYVALSSQINGQRGERHLPSKISLTNGFALLCIVDPGFGEKVYKLKKSEQALGRLIAVIRRRNESILAHGNRHLSRADSAELRETAERVAAAVLEARFQDLREMREALERKIADLLPD